MPPPGARDKSAAYVHTRVTRLEPDARGRSFEVRGCRYCAAEFSFKGGTTSAALRHLKRAHPELPTVFESPPPPLPPMPASVAAAVATAAAAAALASPAAPTTADEEHKKAAIQRLNAKIQQQLQQELEGQVRGLGDDAGTADYALDDAAAAADRSLDGTELLLPATVVPAALQQQQLPRRRLSTSDTGGFRPIARQASVARAQPPLPPPHANERESDDGNSRGRIDRKRLRADSDSLEGESDDAEVSGGLTPVPSPPLVPVPSPPLVPVPSPPLVPVSLAPAPVPAAPVPAPLVPAAPVAPVSAAPEAPLTASQQAITHFLQHYRDLLAVRSRLRFVKHLTHHPREAEMYNVLDADTQVEFVREFASHNGV